MMTSTDVKWEIFPYLNYRFHKIVIDWKGASSTKELDWDNNTFSLIYFDGLVAIREAKIEFFDTPLPKPSVFKRSVTTLISTIKKTRKIDAKRDLSFIEEKSDLNTILDINLKKFDDEFHLFDKDNFTTVITFIEGRSTHLVRSRTSENLNFKPQLFSNSYHVSFYLPKINILKRILHRIFNIGSNNDDVVWFPIEYEPDIKSDKLVFFMPEVNMGHDLQIWYTLRDINSLKLVTIQPPYKQFTF